jgi:antitoxin component of MazEF toxin-antitoxin module
MKNDIPPPHPPGGYGRPYWRKRLGKSGDSLRLYLPHPLCQELGLIIGSEVLVYIVGKVICLQPAAAVEFAPGVVRADKEEANAKS